MNKGFSTTVEVEERETTWNIGQVATQNREDGSFI